MTSFNDWRSMLYAKGIAHEHLSGPEVQVRAFQLILDLHQDHQSQVIQDQRNVSTRKITNQKNEIRLLSNKLQQLKADLTTTETTISTLNVRNEATVQKLYNTVAERDQLQSRLSDKVENRALFKEQLMIGINELVDALDNNNHSTNNNNLLAGGLTGRIEQLQNEIDQFKTCQICFEPFNNIDRVPAKGKCQHVLYCMKCLMETANSTGQCPTCRMSLTMGEIVKVKLNFS